jgi:hypothetical protein
MRSVQDSHTSAFTWRVSCAIASVLLLCYVIALAMASPSSFPTRMTGNGHLPYLMDKPVGEDGYYMLTVAENIAHRGHVTYNGNLEATGIQPLSTVFFAGLDWLVLRVHGDQLDLVRGVLVLGGVLLLCFACQIASIAARFVPQEYAAATMALAFLLVVSDYTLFRLFTYGLETGLYLMFLAVCVQSTLRIAALGRTTTAEAVVLGIAAGFAGETRIDFGLIFACVLATLLFKRWIAWTQALLAGGIAFLLVAPWFLFVHSVDGTWLPSSGRAESTMITTLTLLPRCLRMVSAVLGHLVPWSYAGMSSVSTVVGVVSIVFLIWLLRERCTGFLSKNTQMAAAAQVWVPAFAVLVVIYVIFFNATHFYYRYTSIIAVLSIPMVAALLAITPQVRRYAAAVPVIVMVCFVAWTYGALHTGRIGNSQTIVAGYIHEHYPDARVGAFQSGVVGFFNSNVQNLDGKLNRPALEAERHNRLPEFLDEQKVDVIADWASLIVAYLPQDYVRNTFEPCPVPIPDGASVCLVRRSWLQSGQSNQSKTNSNSR